MLALWRSLEREAEGDGQEGLAIAVAPEQVHADNFAVDPGRSTSR
jgi:hypothetical protein